MMPTIAPISAKIVALVSSKALGGFAAPGLHSDEAHRDRGRHAECPGDGSGETRAVGEPAENPTNRHPPKT
jgi:hypothetical protein